MTRNTGTSTAEEHFAYSLLTASYLLGARGSELEGCLGAVVGKHTATRLRGVVHSLTSESRATRATALATGLALLQSGLSARSWEPRR